MKKAKTSESAVTAAADVDASDAIDRTTRDAMWRSDIDRIAAEAVRDYEALVEQAGNACPPDPDPPPSEGYLRREHLGRHSGPAWKRFEHDMRKIGLVVHEAATSGWWGGPSVTVPRAQLDAVVSATDVDLEHHEVGAYVSVYPAVVWD